MNASDLGMSVPFMLEGEMGYVSIHPEMYPTEYGIAPLGSFFIYCLHPVHGSCHFIIEQDDEGDWTCQHAPEFIDFEFVNWIGKKIESQGK